MADSPMCLELVSMETDTEATLTPQDDIAVRGQLVVYLSSWADQGNNNRISRYKRHNGGRMSK